MGGVSTTSPFTTTTTTTTTASTTTTKTTDFIWGGWSSWSSCSKACGSGQSSRTRVVKVQPQYGGKPCTGSTYVSKSCLIRPCHLPEKKFAGFCRYGSNQKEYKWVGLSKTNEQECLRLCKTEPSCVAFARGWNPKKPGCNLYEGGPYTYGTGGESSTCYIMDLPKKHFAGFCRDGSNQKEYYWVSLSKTNEQECLRLCKALPFCVAFARGWNPKKPGCNLYEGGPYTYGTGGESSTCYIMDLPKKHFAGFCR